jgi:ribosomal protein L20
MPRVKRGVTASRRHKKVLKSAKGYYGARSRVFRVAKQAVTKPVSMRIAIGKLKRECFVVCGFRESTQLPVNVACLTAG